MSSLKSKILAIIEKNKHIFRQKNLNKNFIILLLCLSTISVVITYSAISRRSNYLGLDPRFVMNMLLMDLVLLLALTITTSRYLYKLWVKNKTSGSRLRTRIVVMFSLVSAVPTIIVAVFSAYFFNFGIQAWFNEKVSTALNESLSVAESYQAEHKKVIESDVKNLSHDLSYYLGSNVGSSEALNEMMTRIANDRSLTELIIFHTHPFTIKAHSAYTIPFIAQNLLPSNAIEAAEDNVVIIEESHKVRALTKLDYLNDTYLLVGRLIDHKVIEHMKKTKGAVSEYEKLKSQISEMQIRFSFAFIIVALLLLLIAISLGIIFTSSIVDPINKLVKATKKIKAGDLTVQLEEGPKNDEISILSRAFNLMTRQLHDQRNNLISAKEQIDARRHFSETILSGVSAGIIALDTKQKITMINPSAERFLSIEGRKVIGCSLSLVCPEMDLLLKSSLTVQDQIINREINISHKSRSSIFSVRIIVDRIDEKTLGYIITFDDITALVLAQRSAAWADVARRIAHEIKNPLTPISLAAQRLKKKYSSQVEDSVLFSKYTDTITRHVEDIGHMVEEFVRFARMPSPVLEPQDARQLISEVVFSRECADNEIKIITNLPEEKIIINCDKGQISQAIANLIKNSAEALKIDESNNDKKVIVTLYKTDTESVITINDNGRGFPPELFDRLTEPYVTNKSTGTGLGLAIVKKIIDDHNAVIEFANNEQGGATVRLIFNIYSNPKN